MNNSATDQIKSLENPKQKKSHFWKWFWGISILLVASVFWAIGSQFRSVPLRISKETTYFTEPLTPDGKSVDFVKAIESQYYSDKIATDDNGYRLIVESFGPSAESTSDQFSVICEKIGLDANAISKDKIFGQQGNWLEGFYDSPDFDESVIRHLDAELDRQSETEEPYASRTYDRYDAEDIAETRMQFPWTLADLPMMKDWLSAHEKTVAVLLEATRKPSFEIPFATNDTTEPLLFQPVPEISRMRAFARLLSARANYQIGVGNIDAAIDEMIACKRLGRFMQNQSTLFHRLAGIAIEGLADSVGIFGSNKTVPSEEQLRRLKSEIDGMPQRITTHRWLMYSRLEVLDLVSRFSRGKDISEFVDVGYLDDKVKDLASLGIDWNVVARVVNEGFDSLEFFFEDSERPGRGIMAYFNRQVRSLYVGHALPNIAVGAIFEADRRVVCSNHLQQIVLAMLLYEKDHGTLPPAYTIDEKGQAMHSWRVLLLPYLGKQELYDQLKLDEPWDSPHNKKFWNEDIPFYRCPSNSNAKPGQTTYSVVVGTESAFDGGVGKRLDSFGANRGSLILVAERLNPICWMDPLNEIPLSIADNGINLEDPKTGKKVSGLASDHPSGIQFGFCDGSVGFVYEYIDQEVLKAMLRGTHFGRRE